MIRFGSSGIRGLANVEVTPELALAIGKIVGELYGSVIVGRDPRTTGLMLASAFFAGAMSAGADAIDAGVVTTPTLARGAADYEAGTVVTASHNPAPYNGIKLWNPDGLSFDETQQQEIEAALEQGRFRAGSWQEIGSLVSRGDLIDRHVEAVLRGMEPVRLRVVIDCACGATATITPRLLREMGCEVIAINAQLDGHFPGRDPEPTEENLALLRSAVVAAGADLGIAHDGDGDRMVAVDRHGTFVGGDKLLAIFARAEGVRNLVVPVDASMALEHIFPRAKIWRTRVGDVYVASEVKRRGADFGGEPSGTWIFPKATLAPDGVYAAARLVALVAERPLDDLAREIPSFPNVRAAISFDPLKRGTIEAKLNTALASIDPVIEKIDGWRLTFEKGWALVRFSGTEPKIRLFAESRDEVEAKEIYSRVLSSVQGAL